ncbi:MAG TPA: glutathione transferase GstA [Pseudorhodoplanes sp.]|nr:glutathione transferase GstA [Pseudorhodoplanes sp.]
MKLYFSPGTCSLSPHIALRETGQSFDLVQVDTKTKKTKAGDDFLAVNPKGMVPVLVLDNGDVLTEGPAIVQYIADKKPSALMPSAGNTERYRVLEWLNYITAEIHKAFTPLFKPDTPEDYRTISKNNLATRFGYLDGKLAGKQFLTGDNFTVADAYLFTVVSWSKFQDIDVATWPNLKAFMDRVAARPKVQEAMQAEGLLKAAA